jgi:hypothetical protein
MNRLEEELKKALRQVEPPAGLAERVLARAAKEGEPSTSRKARGFFAWFGTGALRWATACALCVALGVSAIGYYHERDRRGEQAKEQLMLALRITSSKLQVATESVQKMNSPEQSRE